MQISALQDWIEVGYQIFSKKCKPCEIYIWIHDVYREPCFSEKKLLIDGLNMSLPLWAWVEKTVDRLETLALQKKESSKCGSQ